MTDFRKLLDIIQENSSDGIEQYDCFDIELGEDLLIETGVLDITEDSILLEADDKALELLAKHGVKLNEISKAKQVFPNWNDPKTKEFYDKPTFQRIKSGETEPVDTTDYETPPSMREPRFKDYLERRRWELAQAAKKAKGEPTNEAIPAAIPAAIAAYRAVPFVARVLASNAVSNAVAGPNNNQGNSGSGDNTISNANELSNAVDEGELVQGPWLGSGSSGVETDELVNAFLKSRFNSSYLANDENALNELKNDVRNFFHNLKHTNKAFKLPMGKSIEDLVNIVAAKVHNSLTSEINPDLNENRRKKSRRAELKARNPNRSLLGKDSIYGLDEAKSGNTHEDYIKLLAKHGIKRVEHDNDSEFEESWLQGPLQKEFSKKERHAIAKSLGMRPQSYEYPGSYCHFSKDNHLLWFDEKINPVTMQHDVALRTEKGRQMDEAKYRGRTVSLGKPFLTPDGPKKRAVYVKKPNGNVVKVNFGDKKMRIKKSNPKRRKSFRARHNCKNPGPRWKARYWSCRSW